MNSIAICLMLLVVWCYILSISVLVLMHKLKDHTNKMIRIIDASYELIDDMLDLINTLIDEDSSESKQDNSIDET